MPYQIWFNGYIEEDDQICQENQDTRKELKINLSLCPAEISEDEVKIDTTIDEPMSKGSDTWKSTMKSDLVSPSNKKKKRRRVRKMTSKPEDDKLDVMDQFEVESPLDKISKAKANLYQKKLLAWRSNTNSSPQSTHSAFEMFSFSSVDMGLKSTKKYSMQPKLRKQNSESKRSKDITMPKESILSIIDSLKEIEKEI